MSSAAIAQSEFIQTLSARPELPEGRQAPLCILLPGGPGRMPQAARAVSSLGNKLAERGWLVVVPVSPDGVSFFGDAAGLVVTVIDQVQKDPDVRPGKVLLVGVSNGGISALQVAGMIPDRISGVIAVPGMLHPRVALHRLANLPVYFRIGADDPLHWGSHYPDVVRQLKQVGVRLDARLLEDVGHGIPIDWEEIDAWIARELGALAPTPSREVHVSLPAAAGALRTWNSSNGSTVEAALTEIRDQYVILVRKDGRRIRVSKARLSSEDQDFIEQHVIAVAREP